MMVAVLKTKNSQYGVWLRGRDVEELKDIKGLFKKSVTISKIFPRGHEKFFLEGKMILTRANSSFMRGLPHMVLLNSSNEPIYYTSEIIHITGIEGNIRGQTINIK